MTRPVLTLASGNVHKVEEISRWLGVQVRSLRDVPDAPELIEDGDSFEANALIKARGLAEGVTGWTLADDSGLTVDALDGAPGIHSARYAGTHGDDDANNRLLLKNLEGEENRQAQFVCVLALCGPKGQETVVRGECHGRILHSPSGMGGFGYDPLFVPDGYAQSFAVLGPDVKNRISHRAMALRKLREEAKDLLAGFTA